MPGDAVGFDRQTVRAPEVVGDDRPAVEAQRGVDLGTLDVRPVEEVEQEVLEVCPRRRGPVGDDGPQARCAVMTGRSCEQFEDLADRHAVLGLCAPRDAAQRPLGQHSR
jgi:hypothetical protein